MPFRGNIAVLGLPAVVGLWFISIFAFPYLTAEAGQFGIYEQRHQWLLVHVVAGAVALLSGPVQLWLGLNRRTKIPHRIIGVVYVLAVVAGCVAAFYLAFHADFGWVFAFGMTSMAAAWLITTGLATIAICLRRTEQHREWMIRSYIVTFGFVTFRMLVSILELARVGTLVERLTAASWVAWALPLLIGEAILQGRKIFTRPPTAAIRLVTPSAHTGAPGPAAFDLEHSESSYQHQP
jgi:hypothetical protein